MKVKTCRTTRLKTLLTGVIILFIFVWAPAQVDSLLNEVENSDNDTTIIWALNDLCLYYEFTQPDSALYYIEKAIEIGEEKQILQSLSNSYIFRGFLAEDIGDYKTALLYYRKGIKSAEKCGFDHALGRIYNSIGEVYRYQSNFDSAKHYYQRSLVIKEKMKNNNGIAATYNNLSLLYEQEGKYADAIEILKKALKINKDMNKILQVSNNLGNLGIIYAAIGDYQTAMDYYLQSEALLTDSERDNERRAVIYNNLGIVVDKMGDRTKALKFYKKGLRIFEDLGYERQQITLSDNIGIIYMDRKSYDTAMTYFERSLEIGKRIGVKKQMSTTLVNIGNWNYNQEKYLKAIELYKEALKFKLEADDKQGEIKCLVNISSCYIELRYFDKANEYNQQALAILDTIEANELAKVAYKNQYRIYESQKQFDKALDYHVKMMAINDSIINANKLQQINLNAARFESERNEKELLKLNHEKELGDLKIEQQNANIKLQQMIIYIMIAFSIIVLIAAYYIFKLLQKNRKARKIISVQKEQVEEAYEELHQTNEEILAQRDEIERQKHLVDQKNTEITASINYAKRIQEAILPPNSMIRSEFPDSFVLYKPKDIVAGDFYWLENIGGHVFIAAADCTGHGVPGAMVSVVCHGALNRCVREYKLTDPGQILDKTRELVINTFSKSEKQVRDGMDISLARLNLKTKELQWAGANNPIYIVTESNGGLMNSDKPQSIDHKAQETNSPIHSETNSLIHSETKALITIKGNREPIGYVQDQAPFTTHNIKLGNADQIYLFTDGYADQFGGEKGKKMGYRKFREKLLEMHDQDMHTQKELLESCFREWKGTEEQVDDVCIIGIKV